MNEWRSGRSLWTTLTSTGSILQIPICFTGSRSQPRDSNGSTWRRSNSNGSQMVRPTWPTIVLSRRGRPGGLPLGRVSRCSGSHLGWYLSADAAGIRRRCWNNYRQGSIQRQFRFKRGHCIDPKFLTCWQARIYIDNTKMDSYTKKLQKKWWLKTLCFVAHVNTN